MGARLLDFDGLLALTPVATDPDLSLVQQRLHASIEAARAAAREASIILEANPSIDGTRLAGAMGKFLETQGMLYRTVQELVRSPEPSEPLPDSADTAEVDAATTNADSPHEGAGVDNAIGEFPDDWGNPQEWVEAPLGRVFRRRPKRQVRQSL
jgi:hypothetical protein